MGRSLWELPTHAQSLMLRRALKPSLHIRGHAVEYLTGVPGMDGPKSGDLVQCELDLHQQRVRWAVNGKWGESIGLTRRKRKWWFQLSVKYGGSVAQSFA